MKRFLMLDFEILLVFLFSKTYLFLIHCGLQRMKRKINGFPKTEKTNKNPRQLTIAAFGGFVLEGCKIC